MNIGLFSITGKMSDTKQVGYMPDACADLCSYGAGPLASLGRGLGWRGKGRADVSDYIWAFDQMAYGSGPISSLANGVGFNEAGVGQLMDYVWCVDPMGYGSGVQTSLAGGSGWQGNGAAMIIS